RAYKRADRFTQLGGSADAVALPERHLAGLPERGAHEHAVVRDVFDAPARRAEGEDVADARLVHHLLVELADATPAGASRGVTDDEDTEQAAIGDRATRGDREPLRPGAPRDRARDAIPHDAWSKFRELV